MSSRYGGERFKRGLRHFVLGKVVSAASGFFAMVLVVRLLPIHEFADYSVLVSLVEIFTAFSAMGLSHALLRYVPELYARHYKTALREFIFGSFALRTGVLLLATGLTYAWSASIAPVIGLSDFLEAFQLFLLVVIFRTTVHFMSQILESTLHQGIVQLAFSVTSIFRLVGMLYLMQLDHAGLLDVIWVEVLSDAIGMLVMLAGVVHVIWRAAQEEDSPTDDDAWFKKNLRQIAHFSLSGYAQHIVGLPFGSNTNRLVGGHLFSNPVMASFGFAQSLYEYTKRYLPAQLLVGLIRPVVVARYSEKRNFTAAAATCERVILINMALIGGIFSALAVGGHETLTWVSGGKYGMDTLWVLAALLVVLALETHRLILEMLVQTVERYAILIPSNILLSLSILPAILFFPYLGAVGFPLINAVALVFSNLWVKRQLAAEGYLIAHEWRDTAKLFVLMVVASLLGNILSYAGVHWLAAMGIAEIVFLLGTWKLRGHELKAFVADLMGSRKVVPESPAAGLIVNDSSTGMNVKILSMQRVVNYGSFMQAYALKKVVESLGHYVTFCDFKPGSPRHLGEKVKRVRISDRLVRVPYILTAPKKYFEERLFRRKLRQCYKSRAWKKLGIGPAMNYDYACDAMIIGSDEVFNYTQNHAFGYVPALFGHGTQADSIIAYAASAGYASVKDVEADNMGAEISAGFAKFDYLGVRDQNTYEMVARYAKQSPTYVIDPTLLYDFDQEIPPAPISPGYVLVYAYDGRLDAPDDVENILAFAKSKSLRVVSVSFYHHWCEENLVVTPFELLSVFRHAAYVVTDTFHGSIFSIKNRKQFVSLIRGENRWGSNSSKLGFLLHQLGLESRINRDLGQLASHLDEAIDYEAVYQLLGALREASMQFLAKALKEAEMKMERKP